MSTNTQIQAFTGFESFQVETIRHTLAKDASPDQFNLFMSTAVAAGLNPMLNHIYCIVYGGKMSIQISVEGIMYLAKRVEGFAGVDVQLIHEGEGFKAKRVRGDDGKYYWDVEHEIGDSEAKVIGCYVFAYRDGFPPVFEHMKVKEVEHNLTGTNSSLWKKYFNDMFKKHVMKRALKRQYGIEISEDEALDVGSSPEPYVRKDITDEANAAGAQPTMEQPKGTDAEPGQVSETEELWKVVGAKLEGLGHSTKAAKTKYIQDNFKIKGENATASELKNFIKLIDMEIAESAAGNDELE